MKRFAVTAAVAALCSVPASAWGQATTEPPQLTTQALRDNVYMVQGGTANAGFVVTNNGVIVIDAQRTPPEAAAQIKAIAKVTNKPIRTLILTHSDPDHIGGLPAYPAAVDVIAHENTKATIVASGKADGGGPFFGPMYEGLAAGHFIDQTVSTRDDIAVGNVPVQIMFVAPGHSSGDLIVYLPAQRVVFGGDIVLTNKGRFPIIHIGGSSQGWIEDMKAILALHADVIVPGHGPIVSREQLEKQLEDVEKRRAAIKVMIEDGKTLEQIDAALPPEALSPVFPSFNKSTYDELTKGYPEAVPPWANVVASADDKSNPH